MSGGSYNYLCWKEDSDEIFQNIGNLKSMLGDAKTYGKQDFAMELEKYLLDLEMFDRMIQTRQRRLQDLMHGFEWWQSGDHSEEQFDEKWQKFLEGKEIKRTGD